MKQIDPRIVKGSDSDSVVFQKIDKPMRMNIAPKKKRKIDNKRLLNGNEGAWRGGGGLGSKLGIGRLLRIYFLTGLIIQ